MARKKATKKSKAEPAEEIDVKKLIKSARPKLIKSLIATAENTGSIASIQAIGKLMELDDLDEGPTYSLEMIWVPIQRLDDGKYSVIPIDPKNPPEPPFPIPEPVA